jgi:hydroxymethylpyrimidine/phosphomethylpyrimidine kinase
MTAVTAVTAQNTEGVQKIEPVGRELIAQQIDSVVGDIGVDSVKTGMLLNADTVELVAEKIAEYTLDCYVLDPVMVAKGGSKLLEEGAYPVLKEKLIPLALLVTPNLSEATVLSGMQVQTIEDMKEAGKRILDLGARNVLVKGGHLQTIPLDILYDGKDYEAFSSMRIETKNTHGTGCTLSAAIAAELAKGSSLREAIATAKAWTEEAIRGSLALGRGHGPVNPHASVVRQAETRRCLNDLSSSLLSLLNHEVGHLIPEVQSNLGYALPGAKEIGDVAALPGRIVKVKGKAAAFTAPELGGSRHIARVILAVMRHDPDFRSAMNIRYSKELVDAMKSAGLKAARFDRGEEPDSTKAQEGLSLDWGVERTIEREEMIPDAIYDTGEVGKEPMIRVLGKTPREVVDKVLRLADLSRVS